MDSEKLYMMVLVPPADIAKKIEAIRQEFAEAYHCKAALKPPVHITLYPPYKEEENHEKALIQQLSQWCAQQQSFGLTLKGFDAFKSNGVIFINVEKNESLKELHKTFTTQMTRFLQPVVKSKQTYHPHITIGYRDIPRDRFEEAVKDYLPRKFEASFFVDNIAFWKHNGNRWQSLHNFSLGNHEELIRQPSLF